MEVEAAYGRDWADRLSAVYKVFWAHLKDNDDHNSLRLWEHAEEFLEFVDAAADPKSHLQRTLLNLIRGAGSGDSVEEFRVASVQAMAAECSFVERSHPKMERWEPYINWARRLGPCDTIITFNYDRVVERVGEYCHGIVSDPGGDEDCPIRSKSLILPWEQVPRFDGGFVPILKLHGSVDWSYRPGNDSNYRSDLPWNLAASEASNVPLMGTPGGSKKSLTDRYFRVLWNAADEALKGADQIVFLGYRFPPSDSVARSKLLGAIGDNGVDGLTVTTVLGPDIRGKDAGRMTSLLERTCEKRKRINHGVPVNNVINVNPPAYDLVQEPLYVEDYLSLL